MASKRTGFWEGTASYFDGVTSRRREVRVVIEPDLITIKDLGETRPDQFIVQDRQKDFIVLKGGCLKKGKLEIRSTFAVKALGVSGLVKQNIYTKSPWLIKIAILLAASALMLYIFFLRGIDPMAKALTALIPSKIEEAVGDSFWKQQSQNLNIIEKPVVDSVISRSINLIYSCDTTIARNLKVFIINDTSVVNAFAFPGGYIIAFSGIFTAIKTQEEWLGLLAHEAGHIHYRHGLRHLVRTTLVGVVFSLFFGDLSGLTAAIANNGKMLIHLRYSRQSEEEADAFAAGLLNNSEIGAGGLITFFQNIEERVGEYSIPVSYSTHPKNKERIKAIESITQVKQTYRPLFSDSTWQSFKAAIPIPAAKKKK